MSKQAELYIKALTNYRMFVQSQNVELITKLLDRGLKVQCNDYVNSYYFTIILPTQKANDIDYITRMIESFGLLTECKIGLEYNEEYIKVRMTHPH